MVNIVMVEQESVREKVVAFTFDDGPHPVYTPQVLEIFRRAGGQATFFMIGQEIENHPEIAAEVHREGHEIANHTYTHPDLTKLTLEEAGEESATRRKSCSRSYGATCPLLPPAVFWRKR